MPFVTVNTNSGPADFRYDIATPISHSADKIDPSLPTIFFIHAAYASTDVFELQFADPQLRQFNLVTFEMRGYGETRGEIGDAVYTPKESMDDIWGVIEALALPPLHIFGVSIGTPIALELASRHPDHILSMTLCSPLTPTEDEAVKAGRDEVFDLWVTAHKFEGEGPTEVLLDVDGDCLHDIIIGVTQLLFNNQTTKLTTGIAGLAVSRAKRRWSGSRANLREGYKATVSWYLDRQPIPDEQLLKIKCPVTIVHFQQDIAYPVELAHDLAAKLLSADVSPVLDIEGAHMGNVTNPDLLNPILRKTVTDAEFKINKRTFPDVPADAPSMHTPFTDLLEPFSNDSDDSDELVGFDY
ncbi:alpha/beta-hydrolase [Macrolepiota fuliginosa MF-IS2]|uniref:Alpha/beta-hydrolase n=1 Tax=Macrolepiota fuliginosa MF-IS2 TaxID=1400762 RepID=A0A9P6C5X0_9AGAR|nr:alpha/beta-hydrolase [Macrolepiota fuliginosa MF-IS2]